MHEPSRWTQITTEDPEHSARYAERFRTMAAEGRDLGGEARLIDAMAARNSRILDAGCGPGRVGALLHAAGHTVVGVDVDPVLIDAAIADHPGPEWIVGDLAELDLADHRAAGGFDVIVSAGNVMAFLAPSTRRVVLERLRDHLAVDGRLVTGFQAGRDYDFDEFFDHAAAVGLVVDLRLATWDLRPSTPEADFLVAVFSTDTRPN
jgi:SAM-dependent methyltransferase